MYEFKVVGYVDDDGVLVCLECGNSDMEPVFAGSVWGHKPCCKECGIEIDVLARNDW